jgi:hypothetical protein
MPKKTYRASQNKQNNSPYLEVYIEGDGKTTFTPLSKDCLILLERISLNKVIKKQSVYCG